MEKLDTEDEKASKQKQKTSSASLRTPSKPNIAEQIDVSGLSDEEKQLKAEREKNKGNEVRFLVNKRENFFCRLSLNIAVVSQNVLCAHIVYMRVVFEFSGFSCWRLPGSTVVLQPKSVAYEYSCYYKQQSASL